MVQLQYSPKYLSSRKKFLKNNPNLLVKTTKAISLFVKNPEHPGLNLEKLKGSEYWTIRIDKGNRIFFYWINESTVILIDIGKHDKYRKY
jgi:mRNA-degrading endonuclease RelE of RelBE toxin-antitoxin system